MADQPIRQQPKIGNADITRYIRSAGTNTGDCSSSTSPCKTISYILGLNPPYGFYKGSDKVIINLQSTTADQDNNQLSSSTQINNIITVQSQGYISGSNSYTKYYIFSYSQTNSLFNVTNIGQLTLLGVRFDNIKPLTTQPLIRTSCTSNAQVPKVTVIDCVFESANASSIDATLISSGIYRSNILTINNSTFSNIICGRDGTVICATLNNGGLIELNEVTFTNLTLLYNGGAVCATLNGNGKIQLNTLNTFRNLQCTSTSGRGGAFYLILSGSNSKFVTLGQVDFINCTAGTTGGAFWANIKAGEVVLGNIYVDNCYSKQGGAIYLDIEGNGTCTFNGTSTIQNCISSSTGGGIYAEISNGELLISNLNISNCIGTNGGGIYSNIKNSGKMTINGSSEIRNCQSTSGSGGGIYTYVQNTNSTFTISRQLDIKNCISSTTGGGIYMKVQYGELIISNLNISNCRGTNGGGIYSHLILSGQITINGSSEIRNCQSTSGNGGGIYSYIYDSTSQFTISRQLDIKNCTSSKLGGGIYTEVHLGQQLLERVNITSCTAKSGSGIFCQIETSADLAIKGPSLISNCYSTTSGGGIYLNMNVSSASCNISGQVEIKNCSCSSHGGGISAEQLQGKLVLNGVKINNCYSQSGGGIYSILKLLGILTIQGSSLIENCNSTSGSGGGIYIQSIDTSSKFGISGSLMIKDCNSQTTGGGLQTDLRNGEFTFSGINFNNCQSQSGGGGMNSSLTSGGRLNIKDQSMFTNCRSISGPGGAL
ncbi:MAG: hypothetical protein EZS28_027547, partial [Streblomastix strix]